MAEARRLVHPDGLRVPYLARTMPPRHTPSAPLDVLSVVALTIGAAAGGALITGNREFVFYVVVLIVLVAVIFAMHRRVGFSPWLLRGLALWAVLHMAGGLVPVPSHWPTQGEHHVLYSLWLVPGWLKYDQLVHAYGFGITTWAFWQAMGCFVGSSLRPTAGVLFTCVAAAMGCGAANEVVEFIAVLTVPETNVGGYENTGWDLVANAVGAIIAAFVIRLSGARSPA